MNNSERYLLLLRRVKYRKYGFISPGLSATTPLIIFFLFLSSIIAKEATASADTVKIPLQRQFFHEKIDKEQRIIDGMDGIKDQLYHPGKNEEVNLHITDALIRKIDELQIWIEANDSISKNNEKIKLLNYISKTLFTYRVAIKKREITAAEFPMLIDCMQSVIKSNLSEPLIGFIDNQPYSVAKAITDVFNDHPYIEEARTTVYLKYCFLHPENILTTIRPYVNQPFADSLIVVACKKNPVQLYSYAQSVTSPEGKLIHNSSNELVKVVAQLSQTPQALMYFPFLDDILSGRNSIEHIKKYLGKDEINYDSVGYFKLLVSTEKQYFRRISSPAKDTPIAMYGTNGLLESLRDKAVRHFITPINTLHDESNLSKRMKSIDPLTADEIYYVIVMGENDIYTSSYKHSFSRMMLKLGAKPRTDSLLINVHFDFFKKFIKMAANFNRLDTFLRCMPSRNSEFLMKAFVANLDKSGSLEDATDVADSYSSITDKKLQQSILNYVKDNEAQCLYEENSRGALIYGLLKNIFLSADSVNRIDLSSIAGIPSIYEITKTELQDDNGRIIEQVFFYGDEDGKTYFTPFLNSFSPNEWRIIKSKEWVEIRSLKNDVLVFANLPLDYDANLDDSAQVHLNEYLEVNGLYPQVVVHRGHSYWLPGTIERMPINAKIVVLGSCGGYKNLNKILELCPEAHIISTKEIGAGDINKPILNYLHQSFRSDSKIVWKQMWSSLTNLFSKDPNKNIRESWDSYVPPYKNLGAIFLKAYEIAINKF